MKQSLKHLRKNNLNSVHISLLVLFILSCSNHSNNVEIVESYNAEGIIKEFHDNGELQYLENQNNGIRSTYFLSFYDNGQYETIGFEIDSGIWSIMNFDSNCQLTRHFFVRNDTVVYEKKMNDTKIDFISREVIIDCKTNTCKQGDTFYYTIRGSGLVGYNEKAVGYAKEFRKNSNENPDYRPIGNGLLIKTKFVPSSTGIYIIKGELITFIDSSCNIGFSNDFNYEINVLPN